MRLPNDEPEWIQLVEHILQYVIRRLVELAPLRTPGDERPMPSADLIAFETLVLGRMPRRPKDRPYVDWRLGNAVAALVPFLGEPEIQLAFEILRRDFADSSSAGSRAVAAQLGAPNEDVGARMAAMVRQFMDEVAEQMPVEGEA